jgi:hypothetical protein
MTLLTSREIRWMAVLKAIPQNQFQTYFERWTWCWHQCIASQGEYFEGDHNDIQQWGMFHFYHDSSRTLLSDHMQTNNMYRFLTFFLISTVSITITNDTTITTSALNPFSHFRVQLPADFWKWGSCHPLIWFSIYI